MSSTIPGRRFALAIAGFFVLSTHLAAQTTQEPSMADAARIAREQKKSVVQPSRVITNDSLNPTTSSSASSSTGSSQPSPSPGPPSDSSNPAVNRSASATPAKPELSPEDAENLKKEIASLQAQLKDEQGEVDLLKHLLALDKEAYYSKTDYARDTDGKAKLDSEQDELKQKEEEFAKLKAKLESLAPQESANPAAATKP